MIQGTPVSRRGGLPTLEWAVLRAAFVRTLGGPDRIHVTRVDPQAVNAQANRRGGRDKYAAFGPDQAGALDLTFEPARPE